MKKSGFKVALGLCCWLVLFACTKQESILVTGNEAPNVNNVPTIKIENYVNRIFIDLIGREPLDEEMTAEVSALRAGDLSEEVRIALIQKLQTNTAFMEGDTSYQRAYYQQLYNLAKVRCLEGFSDQRILDLSANSPDDEERAQKVISARTDMENGLIQIHELFGRMIFNAAYDEINMNSFNFVNATFDNLLWRFPTNAEFNAGFSMVEHSQSAALFGRSGQNKGDYVQILIESNAFFEGLIVWVYRQLLARNPTTEETLALLEELFQHRDIRLIQQAVMSTNEYANF